jgi:DNA-binding CsgD family transcriptional regulator
MKINITQRENEVFNLLLSGKAPKEIAFTLNINYDTV